MSVLACPKCWDVLCTCGYEWARKSPEDLADIIYRLKILKSVKETYPESSQSEVYAYMKEILKERKHYE